MLRLHTKYPRFIAHWPVWTPSFATLLSNFTIPVWVYEIDNTRMIWGNAAAISLWRKNDLEHFISADYGSDLSDATRLRLHNMEERLFDQGETLFDQWTFYPVNAAGERTAIIVDTHCYGIYLPNGCYGFVVEGIPRGASKPAPFTSPALIPATGNTTTGASADLSVPASSTNSIAAGPASAKPASGGLPSAISSPNPPTGSLVTDRASSGTIISGVATSTYNLESGLSGSFSDRSPPTASIVSSSEAGESHPDAHLSADEQRAILIRESHMRTVESFHHSPYCILLLRPLPPSTAIDETVPDPWTKPGQDMIMQNPEALKTFGSAWSFWGSWSDLGKREKAAKEIETKGSWNDEVLIRTKDGNFSWFRIGSRLMNDPVTAGKLLLVYLVDCSQQKSLEEQLLKAREEAESGNLAKSEFLAVSYRQEAEHIASFSNFPALKQVMSHEIRTPLNSIIGMTTLLMDTERTMTNEQFKCISLIRSSGDSLLSILDDILDFTRIESSKFNLHLEPFLLRRMIEDVLDLFRSQCVTRQLRLTHCIAEDVPDWVKGDEKRIRQILWVGLDGLKSFSVS
jgi:hypothetical protein